MFALVRTSRSSAAESEPRQRCKTARLTACGEGFLDSPASTLRDGHTSTTLPTNTECEPERLGTSLHIGLDKQKQANAVEWLTRQRHHAASHARSLMTPLDTGLAKGFQGVH